MGGGATTEALSIEPMQTGVMPLSVKFEAISLVEGKSGTAALGVIKNLLGFGSDPVPMTLQLKPYFMVGNSEVGMPGYIPIHFDIKNKEK